MRRGQILSIAAVAAHDRLESSTRAHRTVALQFFAGNEGKVGDPICATYLSHRVPVVYISKTLKYSQLLIHSSHKVAHIGSHTLIS